MQKLEAENKYANQTLALSLVLLVHSSLLIDGIGIVAPFNPPIEQFLASQNVPPLSPPTPQMNGMPDDPGGLQTVNGHNKVIHFPPTPPFRLR